MADGEELGLVKDMNESGVDLESEKVNGSFDGSPTVDIAFQCARPYIDIVAVHGIDRDPEMAWKWVLPGGSRSATMIDWLHDERMLPSLVPSARVLQCKYGSNRGLAEITSQLLKRLEILRSGCRERPLVFIAHSFGGIIVQKLLSEADISSPDQNKLLLQATAGVLFLATPFHGSHEGRLAALARAANLQPGEEILECLGPESPVLFDLQLGFSNLSLNNGILVFTCFETEKTTFYDESHAIRGEQSIIVDEASASLPGVPKLGFPTDHSGMSEFSGPTDRKHLQIGKFLGRIANARIIFEAAAEGDVQTVEELIQRRVSLKQTNIEGESLLMIAVNAAKRDVVLSLLGKGIDINKADRKGCTALHHAVNQGNEDMVRILLTHGANRAYKNGDGKSPLDVAYDKDLDKIFKSCPSPTQPSEYQDKYKPPSPPPNEVDPSSGFQARIIDFYGEKREHRHVERPSVHDMLYGEGPQVIMSKRRHEYSGTARFRWYHLPANNMAWVEDLITQIFEELNATNGNSNVTESNSSRTAKIVRERKEVLCPENWSGQQYRGSKSAIHARFMQPSCRHPGSFALFMPFMHYEAIETNRAVNNVLKEVSKAQRNKATKPKTVANLSDHDEKLLRYYLYHEPPLHNRRTLDQFYYYTIISTKYRDENQVVARYAEKRWTKAEPFIIMIDQLWMWLLEGNIVVTSFPQRHMRNFTNQPFESQELDTLDSILEYLDSEVRGRAFSAEDLVVNILLGCSDLLSGAVASNERLMFLEFFERSIGIITHKESVCFRKLLKLSTKVQNSKDRTKVSAEDLDDLFDIEQETQLLGEIKDIRDELNILRTLCGYQTKVIGELSEFFFMNSGTVQNLVRQFGDKIDSMDIKAQKVYDALKDLLDLKQKQATVSEARSQRQQTQDTAKQTSIILLFTIVTVIFLPLSFMCSFFTINIAEYPDKLHLSWVSTYIFSISFGLALIFIAIGFNVDRISKGVLRMWRYVSSKLNRRPSKIHRTESKRKNSVDLENQRERPVPRVAPRVDDEDSDRNDMGVDSDVDPDSSADSSADSTADSGDMREDTSAESDGDE